jgi:NADH-quinone oxidoreductase subunit I
MIKYITGIIKGIATLIEGLGITFKHMFHKPITLQYPEEKPDLSLRFRGRVAMPVDTEKGDNRCTACGLCIKACPNATIAVTKQIVDEKPKPKAATFTY